MNISGIYKIESKLKPERCYVGSAVNIHKRWKNHTNDLKASRHSNKKLQNHFNKYGESDLQFSILLGCEKEDLIKTEQYFLDSYNPFFNICKIAGSSLGIKHSEEFKKKVSESGRGLKHNYPKYKIIKSPETIAKLRLANRGKKRSIETCLRISISKKGIIQKQLLKGWSGRKHSEETKIKMRNTKLGKKRGKYKLKIA